MKKPQIFVSPRGDGKWQVKTAGKTKPSKILDSKKEARTEGIKQAKNAQTELTIQNRDGKIGEKNSYGNDPYPPKDKR